MNFPARRICLSLRLLAAFGTLGASTAFLCPAPVHAQDLQAVSKSALSYTALPSGAARVAAKDVPKEINDALGDMIKSGGPIVKRGRTEVLVWADSNYKPAKAKQFKSQVGAALTKAGWEYEEGEEIEDAEGATMISAIQTKPSRRALIGIWMPTEDALLLAWTEMLPSGVAADEPQAEKPAATKPATKPATPGPQTPPPPSSSAPGAGQATGGPLTFEVASGGARPVINVMKGQNPTLPSFPATQVKPGFVRGWVKDAKGKPLTGAVIGVRSTAIGGAYSGAQAKTDARGFYEVAVPLGAAHFYCAGYAADYYDGLAAFGLHPTDGEASQFASANGAVENWVLLPYGVADRADAQENPQYFGNYYGGSFWVSYYAADSRFDGETSALPVGSEIDLTLIPDGPLFDGSQGRTFVFRQKVVDGIALGFTAVNLPVGRYRVVALLRHDGRTSPLKIKESGPHSNGPFGLEPKSATESATLTFRPYGAKPGMATAAKGHWESLSISLER